MAVMMMEEEEREDGNEDFPKEVVLSMPSFQSVEDFDLLAQQTLRPGHSDDGNNGGGIDDLNGVDSSKVDANTNPDSNNDNNNDSDLNKPAELDSGSEEKPIHDVVVKSFVMQEFARMKRILCGEDAMAEITTMSNGGTNADVEGAVENGGGEGKENEEKENEEKENEEKENEGKENEGEIITDHSDAKGDDKDKEQEQDNNNNNNIKLMTDDPDIPPAIELAAVVVQAPGVDSIIITAADSNSPLTPEEAEKVDNGEAEKMDNDEAEKADNDEAEKADNREAEKADNDDAQQEDNDKRSSFAGFSPSPSIRRPISPSSSFMNLSAEAADATTLAMESDTISRNNAMPEPSSSSQSNTATSALPETAKEVEGYAMSPLALVLSASYDDNPRSSSAAISAAVPLPLLASSNSNPLSASSSSLILAAPMDDLLLLPLSSS
eukprot:CAMPEP_0175082408 /NCGR_PEP_ID=MMETSP0052_2-20121109/26737_1 /TAXON_ID=51329 ORGANISM="Polytomella parva, Strain SAG 63-3" /NCGR_SAMPLE_ID=MMETSP0052_2 /ASSEMBLY_ACC=CAM_ASM_000194 /LENGTH=437 /DNA_ID=CAMNT_0016353597 /DNA_START=78 /DNA_END=1387 /DNA_ORIENTATION=-